MEIEPKLLLKFDENIVFKLFKDCKIDQILDKASILSQNRLQLFLAILS